MINDEEEWIEFMIKRAPELGWNIWELELYKKQRHYILSLLDGMCKTVEFTGTCNESCIEK